MFELTQNLSIYCNTFFPVAGNKLREYLNLFYGINSVLSYCDCNSSDCSADSPDTAACSISITQGDLPSEHYTLLIKPGKVVITAGDLKGAIYGVSTFLQKIDRETLTAADCDLCDKPYKQIRGAHLYLPARENIDAYKKILEVMAFFKMNTVIIEVSGAMEYEKHPEINQTWEWFCDLADNRFPGEAKSRSIQWSDIYWKDSIHTEHAGGSFLTKAEVADIVAHAKSLGLDVIPEIQALSHSYYLTLAHREIAELQDDMFPDSYCPLNEKSYELYFEVAEEVLEVFKPSRVSIGHDEVRVLGQCEKCREKTGHELLAYELNRLHDFYEKHNIKIFMWGEMLQHYTNFKGLPVGEGIDRLSEFGFHYTLPATYNAKHSIPKDITMLDWQYSLSHYSQDMFMEDGFPVLFGNLRGSRMLNWKKRTQDPRMLGGEVSTWVVTDEETFARDGIFFEFMFSSHMLWEDDYDTDKYAEMAARVNDEAFFTKAIMRGEVSVLESGGNTEVIYSGDAKHSFAQLKTADITCPSSAVTRAITQTLAAKVPVSDSCDNAPDSILYGVPIDTTGVLIKKEFKADSLLFLHSAKQDMVYKPSHQFPSEEPYGLGTYAVLYDDGTLELANIIYGRTIGNIDFKMICNGGQAEAASIEIDNETGSQQTGIIAPTFAPASQWNDSILYITNPVTDGTNTAFAYEWKNPFPEKTIVKMKAIHTCHNHDQSAILFGILAVTK